MRVDFFSPLPPAKSGIADYSAMLLAELRPLVGIETHAGEGKPYAGPAPGDVALYQLGNNADHIEAYEAALRHPGVVVLHEANLHHLITDLTIRRKDWDGYVLACAYDGGEPARAFAERVRALEVGPDYDGVPMLRRVLERSRGLIVHSRYVGEQCRAAGYQGPLAVIPHGAAMPAIERMNWRARLGLGEAEPLVGIFGYMKPYKRVSQSLRAFARLRRLVPEARLLMVGEEHPEFPLDPQIRALGLQGAVRRFGYATIEEFEGYLSACDVVLNLRFPTVGETSGTLLRAFGMSKAAIVSDVGSFAEFPDEVCLKVPVDASEEDTLFESLNLLVSRPDLARSLGAHARAWVERECSWSHVARLYASFLEAVAEGREWRQEVQPAAPSPAAVVEVPGDYVRGWAEPSAREYVDTHLTRLVKTLEMTPAGGPDQRILEMGAYLQITPSLKTKLGYGEVRGCYYGPAGTTDHREAVSIEGEHFTCEVDLFDAEHDPFPYGGAHFDTVLCCELLEHLTADPMHMMAEIHRILKPGGHLVLTTPNIGSLRAIAALLAGYHPGFFPAYIKPAEAGSETDARHNREYTAREIYLLFHDSGFDMVRLETGEFKDIPRPEHVWVENMLRRYGMPDDLRGDGIYAVGRKSGPMRSRWPAWLYS
ncbi:MAG: methyltransferase domain-containing protein [Acidobacteria bacterium]|nr:methyltransferase domain-containing protein [Acidobacteriota bacterium]